MGVTGKMGASQKVTLAGSIASCWTGTRFAMSARPSACPVPKAGMIMHIRVQSEAALHRGAPSVRRGAPPTTSDLALTLVKPMVQLARPT